MSYKRTVSYLFGLSFILFCLLLLKSASFLSSSLSHARFELPWLTYQYLAACFFSHLFLISIWSACLTYSSIGLAHLAHRQDPFYVMLIIWLIATLSLFALNQVFYPQSHYAFLSSTLINDKLALVTGTLVILCLIALCFFGLFISHDKKRVGVGVLIGLALLLYESHDKKGLISPHSYHQPDIIVLGIDALRMHQLSHAPLLSERLRHSTLFTQAETPLARTFPAWVSILTGLYPIHHGARFNLTNPSHIKVHASFAWDLQMQGYDTIYASDEKRFSQIGETFGFKKVIGPKPGVNDFIQGQINDMPLSNLIMNTTVGRWLFPYNHANRASYVHYYPDSFNSVLDTHFQTLSPSKPLFLCIHLTLTHWPLIWGKTPQSALLHENELYARSLSQLDKQLANIIRKLTTYHRLDNAILVLLSDHGDAVLSPHSRLTEPDHYHSRQPSALKSLLRAKGQALDKSFGHGTDVLSPLQTRTLLAFQCYGQIKCPVKKIDMPVSLIDIKPTLANLMTLKTKPSDGLSLVPLFNDRPLADRILLSETGFDPNQQLGLTPQTNHLHIQKVITIAKENYQINKHNESIILKQKAIDKLIKRKQLAAHKQDWILALYPNESDYIPVLLNTKTLAWTEDLNSDFATNAPTKKLLHALREMYPAIKDKVPTLPLKTN